MAALKEMRYLKDEEKAIKQVIEKFQDQLNRLKVEELSLKAELREKDQAKKSQDEKRMTEPNTTIHNLDLTFDKIGAVQAMENEEIEEEDDDYY